MSGRPDSRIAVSFAIDGNALSAVAATRRVVHNIYIRYPY